MSDADERPDEQDPSPGTETARPRATRRVLGVARWCAVGVLCLALTLSVVGAVGTVFVRDQWLHTDNFVVRAVPLARDPAIREEVTQRLTARIAATLDVDALSGKAKKWVVEKDPPESVEPALRSALSGLREYVEAETREFVHSEKFTRTWETAVRAAHTETVKVLDGRQGEVLRHEGTALSVELGPVVKAIKSKLVDSGFGLAEDIPRMNPKLSLMDSDLVPQSQEYTRQLRSAADWSPWLAVACLGSLLLLAPGRRRALMFAGMVVGAVGLAVAVAAWTTRERYLAGVDDAVVPPVVRALTAGMIPQYMLIGVAGIAVALACWLLGRFLKRRAVG